MAGSDVNEFLGGLWTPMSQLVNQGLTGGPKQESSYDIDVGDIKQLVRAESAWNNGTLWKMKLSLFAPPAWQAS